MASPLHDCVVTFSGTLPLYPKHSQAGAAVSELGGTVASSVTKATTHLVVSPADFTKPSVKVKKATEFGIFIVSSAWLGDSQALGVRASEQAYALSSLPVASGGGLASLPIPVSLQPGPAVPQLAPAPPVAPAALQPLPPSGKRGPPSPGTDDQDTAPQPKRRAVESASKPLPTVGKGQVAKSKDLVIPLDDNCPFLSSRVYIDPTGVIYDASLNQSNASNNNNKFYRIQILYDANGMYRTWTRWGRVGERGQIKVLESWTLDGALGDFEKKFKDKTKLSWANRGDPPKAGKYVFVERSYDAESDDSDDDADDADAARAAAANKGPPPSKLDPPVQDLMRLIFNHQLFAATMSALNFDAVKLPLGKLSKATITRGFQALKTLSEILDDPAVAATLHQPHVQASVEQLSNLYFSHIPHSFGRNRPPVINSVAQVKAEIELLDSLSNMRDAALIMKTDKDGADAGANPINPLDKQYEGLRLNEMEALASGSDEWNALRDYLVDTCGDTHALRYKVEAIFRIDRMGEKDQFDASPFAKFSGANGSGGIGSDRRLLWHGSRTTNFGGILSQGLRIAPPEAPVSGYMFGKGIYLADMSSKSANYCYAHMSQDTALLLLCEAELGDPMQQLTDASYTADEEAKSKGMVSTWGKGLIGPSAWKDCGSVNPAMKGVKMPDTTVKPGDTNVPDAYLQYNEYICYDVSQVRMRYLFRVQIVR